MLNDKKAFLLWLTDEGAIHKKENVFHAEKAFFANTVVNWCAEEVKKGTMKSPQVNNCMKTLRRFLRGKIDLCWGDGIIIVPKKTKENEKK